MMAHAPGAVVENEIEVIPKPKPGRQKRLSPAQLEGLAEDYRSGMPLREIAFKYQVHRDG